MSTSYKSRLIYMKVAALMFRGQGCHLYSLPHSPAIHSCSHHTQTHPGASSTSSRSGGGLSRGPAL